ncbi:MAG: DUF1805 domain-containing protein [Candidatus Margulisiibacteriota bacterium]
MKAEKIQLDKKSADGFVFEFGPVNMVFAKTSSGMIGCGLVNVMVFDKFNYPAALIKSVSGAIKDLPGLLEGTVKEVNENASKKGVIVGMSGREALEMM